MSYAARARRRAAKANPLGGKPAQIAPSHPMPPVVCMCGCPRLIHRDGGRCLRAGCGCESYVEAT